MRAQVFELRRRVIQQPTNAASLLHYLQEQDLEEGKRYLREHKAEFGDPAIIGPWLREESLKFLHTQPSIALKLADLLIFYGLHVEHPASYALGMLSRGSNLVNRGYYQAALKCLDEGGETLRTLGDELNWARSRIVWIIACAWLGDVEAALKEADRAREVFLRLEAYYWSCALDINTAVICKYAGRYQQALELYDRVLQTYPLLKDSDPNLIRHSIAIAENNKATNLALLGRFEESSRRLVQAQRSFETLGDMRSVLKCELNLASNQYVQGYYGSALRHYYNARDMYRQHNFEHPLMLSEMLQQMALCFSKLNRVNDACQLAAQAVETVKSAGEAASADKVEPLREYAMILMSTGQLNEALEVLAEAEDVLASDTFTYLTATTRLRRAEILIKQGLFESGYALAQEIRNYCEDQGLVALSLRARIVMVEALIGLVRLGEEQEQRLQLAEELCRPLIVMAQQHNLQDIAYRSRHLLGRMAQARGDKQRAIRYLHSAIGHIEHVLNDLVYDLSPTFLRTAWEVYEDMISLQLQQGHAELAFHYLERARSIALRQYLRTSDGEQQKDGKQAKIFEEARRAKGASVLQREYELTLWQGKYHSYSALLSTPEAELVEPIEREQIEAELKLCEAKITELFEWLHLLRTDVSVARLPKERSQRERSPISKVEVAPLRDALSNNQTLLAYYIHQDSLIIFALTREKLYVYEQAGQIAQLEQTLLLLHAHLQPGGWPDAQHPPISKHVDCSKGSIACL
ncbi:hypothetical protein [Ktedonospora formicarum]|uniref:MalT-like TPR region domain-containing protein n=1 Tax=Ktedonospora formicarum TaxID=2778364 RepID=A0A8J3MSE2_9CHLR|nr:hypothetical protein [Ktedonospora formicarum]GHO44771.1 hypothetical protein KSX_29340 [Ktedonospora formicarum]